MVVIVRIAKVSSRVIQNQVEYDDENWEATFPLKYIELRFDCWLMSWDTSSAAIGWIVAKAAADNAFNISPVSICYFSKVSVKV